MDAAEPFNAPVNPEALGIPVSVSMWNAFEISALLFLLCFNYRIFMSRELPRKLKLM